MNEGEDGELHKTLRRQLKKVGIEGLDEAPSKEQWEALLGRLNASYEEADRDRYLLERMIDVSSEELNTLNAKLESDRTLLTTVLGSLNTAVLQIDHEEKLGFINPYGRDLLLIEEGDGDLKAEFEFFKPDGEKLEDSEVREALFSEGSFFGPDVTLLRKDGVRIPVSLTISLLMDPTSPGVVMSMHDISALKEAERQAREAHIEAKAAESARMAQQTFLANMSHELRTPLNAVIGYTELVIEELQDANLDEHLSDMRRIERASLHLLELINDVLDMSKIQAGHVDLEVTACDIAALLLEVQDTVAPAAEKNGNKVTLEFTGEIEVESDALRLKQALLNVASNACKFTSDGTIVLEAFGREDDVLVTVRDEGIGMTQETLDRVFHAFVQANPSTERVYGGTGLGLAISKDLCDLMGVKVGVESVQGEGTTFWFEVPRRFHTEDAVVARKEAPTLGDEVKGLSGMNVLIIDDDPDVHELVSRYLSKEGVETLSAYDGAQGIHAARERSPDFILLDIKLPTINGWDVLTVLKSDPDTASIPLLMVSIESESSRAFHLGAQDFIVKPVTRERLLETLSRFKDHEREGTVLIVEDDNDLRHIMRKQVEQQAPGWRTRVASNGLVAQEELQIDHDVDLIMLDLMMPGMDGFGLLEVLADHDDWRHIPVVVVTAMELTPTQRDTIKSHTSSIIEKGKSTPAEIATRVIKELGVSPGGTT